MYVIRYITKDGEDLGYHTSIYCTTSKDKAKARIFKCDSSSVNIQKEIIRENLKVILDNGKVENCQDAIFREVRENCFKSMEIDDIVILEEEYKEEV